MPLADWRPQQDGEGKESKTGTAERIWNGGWGGSQASAGGANLLGGMGNSPPEDFQI